jgi:hypothetical protein
MIGLANRRLQPLGHLSEGRQTYKTLIWRSNPHRGSGDSGDSGAVLRVNKSGHTAALPDAAAPARESRA